MHTSNSLRSCTLMFWSLHCHNCLQLHSAQILAELDQQLTVTDRLDKQMGVKWCIALLCMSGNLDKVKWGGFQSCKQLRFGTWLQKRCSVLQVGGMFSGTEALGRSEAALWVKHVLFHALYLYRVYKNQTQGHHPVGCRRNFWSCLHCTQSHLNLRYRVYKNNDPWATNIKHVAEDVFAIAGQDPYKSCPAHCTSVVCQSKSDFITGCTRTTIQEPLSSSRLQRMSLPSLGKVLCSTLLWIWQRCDA